MSPSVARAGRSLLAFCYDFVVGDDWTVVVAVIVLLGGCAVLTHSGSLDAWWVPALGVALVIPATVWRSVRAARGAAAEASR